MSGLLSRLRGPLPALAALLIAIALHYAMVAAFGQNFSGIFFVYLAAIVIAAWCGSLPGLLVVLIVVFGVPLLFQPGFSIAQVRWDGLAVLIVVSLLASGMAAAHSRIRQLRRVSGELDGGTKRQIDDLQRTNAELTQKLVELETRMTERERAWTEQAALLAAEQTARAESDAANRAKDEFLALLGHELRNPLSAMSNGMALLRANPNPERRAWLDQMLDRQVQQMQRMVGDLLDVTRLTRGKIELHKSRIELKPLLDRAVEANRQAMDEQKHKLSVSYPPQPLFVDADAARLEQIVGHLLSNAAKFTPSGGEITLSAEKADGEVVIRCIDSGVGLDSDVLERIFEPFVQFRAMQEPISGLGVGLTLAKKLAELHGGSVAAASTGLGRGSEFTVRLPLAENGERPAAKPASPAERAAVQSHRILLIEDSRELAMVTAELLRDRGQNVRLAFSGAEGVDIAREFHPQIVLCDLNLPDQTGFEVAKSLREDTSLDSVILVGVTAGYVEGYEPGATAFDRFLTKPLVWPKLRDLLGSLEEGAAT